MRCGDDRWLRSSTCASRARRKARADKEVRAAQNRVAFGRTKAERDAAKAEQTIADRNGSICTSLDDETK